MNLECVNHVNRVNGQFSNKIKNKGCILLYLKLSIHAVLVVVIKLFTYISSQLCKYIAGQEKRSSRGVF